MATPRLEVYYSDPIELEIASYLWKIIQTYEAGTIYITPDVYFNIYELIKKCRRNYWGVFEEPNDPISGEPKIFVPLSEWVAESTANTVDLDLKDINLKTFNPVKSLGASFVLKYLVKRHLEDDLFGIKLNKMIRNTAIDGTQIVKVTEGYSYERKKKCLETKLVDSLNFLIDHYASSTQTSNYIVERATLTYEEVMSYNWRNNQCI